MTTKKAATKKINEVIEKIPEEKLPQAVEAMTVAIEKQEKLDEAKALRETVNSFILGQDLNSKLTPAQIEMCISTAMAFKLNPLKREIHFVPRYDNQSGKYNVNVLIGYEVYLKRANHTGKLNGWGVEISGTGSAMSATVTIYVKGWEFPFKHQVFLDEVSQAKSPVWQKMPRFMLKKAAISQAFRLAFPEDLGGMPYTAEEMGMGQISDGQYIEDKKIEAPVAKPITLEKAKHIEGLFVLKGKDKKPVLDHFKIKGIYELNEKQADGVITRLNSFPDKDADIIPEDDEGMKIANEVAEGLEKEGI